MAYSGHLPLPSSPSPPRYLHLRPTFITISAAHTTPRYHQPSPNTILTIPPPPSHNLRRTTTTTIPLSPTSATPSPFPPQIHHHCHATTFIPLGYPPPNHHRGGGRTTVQPPQPHLVVSGCDGATPWDASSGHPPKTTTMVAAEPTVTTTAAPWYMLASLDGMECGYRRTWTW
ncbi:hypothetical protein Tco_0188906 [Tanacetum coccineum]